jgi:anthranilate synthase/aminodeoxychorismate synthase-like glutamine amidotransferase
MLLMIDNYDSFTYNLVQYFGELGEEVRVFRNDRITLEEIEKLRPARIVISPGPCTPEEAGISVATIRKFAGDRRGLRRAGHSQRPSHARQNLSHPS